MKPHSTPPPSKSAGCQSGSGSRGPSPFLEWAGWGIKSGPARVMRIHRWRKACRPRALTRQMPDQRCLAARSEEHTSELQSPDHLVCRLLPEKKNNCQPYARRFAQRNWSFRPSDCAWHSGGQWTIATGYAARKRIFFFIDTATTEIYTLSLHDALPI